MLANLPEPILLAGPTAVGKSEIALRLAERVRGEIVSFDSMQVYRGMDIGTAKPSAAERARVPHHLLDVVPVSEPFDTARFLELAKQAVRGIQQRGLIPILCGGTGLYFKAYLCGLGEAPASDPNLRRELEGTPLEGLLEELRERDPEAFGRIDRNNPRRVIRSVEVLRLSRRPVSELRAEWQTAGEAPVKHGKHIGLERPPSELRQRIDRRVEEMFHRGLVEETKQLLAEGLAANRIAMQALGYRQVAEHLQGARDLAETVELVKRRTRHYAKRQMTWFRRQLSLHWVTLQEKDTPERIAERISEKLKP
jgi:tRNA dimethylallyltransferase